MPARAVHERRWIGTIGNSKVTVSARPSRVGQKPGRTITGSTKAPPYEEGRDDTLVKVDEELRES